MKPLTKEEEIMKRLDNWKKYNAICVPEIHKRNHIIANTPQWLRAYFEMQGVEIGIDRERKKWQSAVEMTKKEICELQKLEISRECNNPDVAIERTGFVNGLQKAYEILSKCFPVFQEQLEKEGKK